MKKWISGVAVLVICQTPLADPPETDRLDEVSIGSSGFYAYTATFRGGEGKTRLEVYTGISARLLVYKTVETEIVLYDTLGTEVFRRAQRASLRHPPPDRGGWLVPGVATVDLTPGRYEMVVHAQDLQSHQTQAYRQTVVVERYDETPLLLSDIEMGGALSPEMASGAFVKEGHAFAPMASLTFLEGYEVVVYFEVYNLSLEKGASSYRVDYRVRSPEEKDVGIQILSGMGRLLGRTRKPSEVTITYALSGKKTWEAGYLELKLDRSETGPQELTVTVTDVHSGQTASKSIPFHVGER